jgi:hypothetical protein
LDSVHALFGNTPMVLVIDYGYSFGQFGSAFQ